jgi:uncharacterized protein (DUF2126 family)
LPPGFRAGCDPFGLCAAGPALAIEGRGSRLAFGEMEDCGAAMSVLVPGDSPVGYRLPLGSLPHVPASSYPYVNPSDPTSRADPICRIRRKALDAPGRTRVPPMPRRRRAPSSPPRRPRSTGRADHRRSRRRGPHGDLRRAARRPAVRVHAAGRRGRGLSRTGIAAAEVAADRLGLPVHIEGYGPPHDPRLNVIRVAPIPA